jgi:hypothetical protein
MSAKNIHTGDVFNVSSNTSEVPFPREPRQLDPGKSFEFDMVMRPIRFNTMKNMPPGEYELTFEVKLRNISGQNKLAHWTGTIKSKPVTLTVLQSEKLSLNITPSKNGYDPGESLKFKVVWKNTSAKPLLLFDSDYFTSRTVSPLKHWQMIAKSIDTGELWIAASTDESVNPDPRKSVRLEPGAAHTFDAVVGRRLYFQGKRPNTKIESNLPSGRYQITFTFNLQKNFYATETANFAIKPYAISHWTGKAAVTVPITINPPQ